RSGLREHVQSAFLGRKDYPVASQEFDAMTKNVKNQFAALMSYYTDKQQTPPVDVLKLQETLTRTDADVVRLRDMPWRSGTKPDVERGVADAQGRLRELADQIERAIKDMQRTDPATIDTLVEQLKSRTFAS